MFSEESWKSETNSREKENRMKVIEISKKGMGTLKPMITMKIREGFFRKKIRTYYTNDFGRTWHRESGKSVWLPKACDLSNAFRDHEMQKEIEKTKSK